MIIFLKIFLPTLLFMIICFYNLIDYSIVYEKLIIANTINYSLISQNIINDDGEINFVRDNLDQIFNDTYAKCLKKSTNLNFTYQWKVKPKNCSSKINVVLMIKSSIYKGEMRRILRQRWARNVSISQYHIRRIFLIGSAPSDQKSVLLDHEIAIHDDILQGDFLDTYKGGTKKVLLGMRYVKLFCSSTRLIIFADDDAVISMWNFLQYFDDILGDRSATANLLKMIAGFEIRDSQPRRKKMDRWYVDYDDYSCPFYPPYFAGVVYAMTFPALQAVYNYSRAFDPFFCDDVLLGILGRLSGVHFRPLPQHVYSPFCDLVYKSHAAFLNSTNFAACHEAEKPADQIFLWNKLCHWPVAEYPKDIALLNEVYCRSFV